MKWINAYECWTTNVRCPLAGSVEIFIRTMDKNTEPTEIQIAALEDIQQLPVSLAAGIAEDARRFAIENMNSSMLECVEESDFQLRFSEGLIPPLRKAADRYFFLAANTDIEPEHGVACLFKNGAAYRVCHSDLLYEAYDWDEIHLFENELRLNR